MHLLILSINDLCHHVHGVCEIDHLFFDESGIVKYLTITLISIRNLCKAFLFFSEFFKSVIEFGLVNICGYFLELLLSSLKKCLSGIILEWCPIVIILIVLSIILVVWMFFCREYGGVSIGSRYLVLLVFLLFYEIFETTRYGISRTSGHIYLTEGSLLRFSHFEDFGNGQDN